MPDPEQTTRFLRPRTSIFDLLRALQARRELVLRARADYVTVRAGERGGIAVFLHRDRVSVALDPVRAYELEHVPPFTLQLPRTPAVSYVIVGAGEIAPNFEAVVDLAVESLDWRACGRTPEICARCGVGCSVWLDICPNCWVEVRQDGHCGCRALVQAS